MKLFNYILRYVSWKLMKNPNVHKHCIVLDVLPFTNPRNGSEFRIAVYLLVTSRWGPLESHVRVYFQRSADMVTNLGGVRLIHNGKLNLPQFKGPLQDNIVISLHHLHIQSKVLSHAPVYTVKMHPHTEFVPIQTGVESRAVQCSNHSINGVLPTLSIVFNPPDVRTVTDTPFVLQQLGFIVVESEK